MANINRDYLIVCDVKKSNVTLGNGTMAFNILDENTSNIFINLVVNTSDNALIQKYANIENAEDYRVIMNIVKPTNEVMSLEAKLHDRDLALFEIELPANATNAVGNYACELLTKCTVNGRQEVTTSNALSYSVVKSVFTDIEDSEILESETYPLVMELFDKLHDIDRYEEDRRQAEIIRQLNEEARIADYDKFKTDVVEDLEAFRQEQKDSISDNLNAFVDDMTAQLIEKKAYVDGVTDEVVARLDEFTAEFERRDEELTNVGNALDGKIEEMETTLDDKITNVGTTLDDKLTNAENTLGNRLDVLIDGVGNKENQLNNMVSSITGKFEGLLDDMEEEVSKIEDRYNNSELGGLLNRLETIEEVNRIQEVNIANERAINRNQDVSIACLFANSQDQMVSIDVEGNSVQLANSKDGYALVNEIQGKTMVNLNKDVDKELVLTEPIALEGQEVNTDKGVDGAKVDVFLEGNTMVNLIDQEESFPLTMPYIVETGNHVAFQGDYDGKAKPYITGNSMVNLASIESSWSYYYDDGYFKDCTICETSRLKLNTVYTVIFDITLGESHNSNYNTIEFGLGNSIGSIENHPGAYINGTQGFNMAVDISRKSFREVFSITFNNFKDFKYLAFRPLRRGSAPVTGEFANFSINMIFLEGDYTNKPIPSHFEGLQSSFEGQLYPVRHQKFTDIPISGGATQKLLFDNRDNVVDTTKGITIYNPNNINWTITYGDASALTSTRGAESSETIIFIKPNSGEYLRSVWTQNLSSDNYKTTCIVVEGDLRSYDFANFKQQYKVDYVSTGKNKFNGIVSPKYKHPQYQFDVDSTGLLTAVNKGDDSRPWTLEDCQYHINLPKGTYTATLTTVEPSTNGYSGIRIYNHSHSIVSWYGDPTTNIGTYTNTFTLEEDTEIGILGKLFNGAYRIQIEEGSTATAYELFKQTTKTVHLNSPLLKGDTIEVSGNNIVHVHRSVQLTFNGTENWVGWGGLSTMTRAYVALDKSLAKRTAENDFLCDTLPVGLSDMEKTQVRMGGSGNNEVFVLLPNDTITDVAGVKQWLADNPTTIVYELRTPTYEVISQNDNLFVDSYVGGHLDFDSAVPVERVNFIAPTFNVRYVKLNTNYVVQFEADNVGELNTYTLNWFGSTGLKLPISKGINRVTIPVGGTLYANQLTFHGIGCNISKVVVTEATDKEFSYFKGLQSVGEKEDKNLFTEIGSVSGYLSADGKGNASTLSRVTDYISVQGGEDYLFTCENYDRNNRTTIYYDKDKNVIGHKDMGTSSYGIMNLPLPLNCKYIRITYCVTSTNFVLKKNEVFEIESHNKNLFNGTFEVRNAGTHMYFKDFMFEEPGVYAISFEYNGALSNSLYIDGVYNNSVNVSNGMVKQVITVKQEEVGKEIFIYRPEGFDDTPKNVQIEKNNDVTSYVPHQSHTQQLTHEPLRAVGDIKDRYVLIDGEWYIERNCGEVTITEEVFTDGTWVSDEGSTRYMFIQPSGFNSRTGHHPVSDKLPSIIGTNFEGSSFLGLYCSSVLIFAMPTEYSGLEAKKELIRPYLQNGGLKVVYELNAPQYEKIDYNPLSVYSDTTYISTNSTMPCNLKVKNHGFNAIIKPSATYTIASNLGVQTIVTGTDTDSLRLTGTGTIKDVRLFEGTVTDIPAQFSGIQSAFEQNYDETIDKYKVEIKTTGKNLWEHGDIVGDISIFNYEKPILKKGMTYTISGNCVKQYDINQALALLDKESNLVHYSYITQSSTVVITEDIYTIYLYSNGLSYGNSKGKSTTFKDIQIELNDMRTPYEPYKQSTISFYLDEPLRGIGDVRDRVFVENGEVKVKRVCGAIVLDGSSDESWWISNSATTDTNLSVAITRNDMLLESKIINDKFAYGKERDTVGRIMTDTNFIRVNISKSVSPLLTGSAGFKEWLQSNPITVVHELAEPTIETIDTTALRLQVFEGGHLFFDSDMPTSSKIEYTIDVPLLNEVAEVSSITDEQDMLIVDMATQLAVMNLTL